MELHVTTSTFKAANTMPMADGMEQCRKSMGGHGFLNAAGVGPQMLSALPQATYEGDYVVLSIQVGTAILKLIGKRMLGGKIKDDISSLQYILDYDPYAEREPMNRENFAKAMESQDPKVLVDLLVLRANFLHYSAAEKFQEMMQELGGINKQNMPIALDDVKIEFMALT